MDLVLTFVAVTVALTTFLWALSVFVQPYIYSQMVDRLPLRALVGGLALGLFLTGWTYLNTRSTPTDKYGTFFEFNPTVSKEVTEFDAVRRLASKGPDGNWREDTVSYRRTTGRNPVEFVEVKHPDRKYQLNSSGYMTIAMMIPVADGQKLRFDAELDPRGQSYTAAKQFRQQGGRRYLEGEYPGMMYEPHPWAAVGALFINFFQFVLWFVVFWPVLRYGSGVALGFAVSLGLVTMLVVMPLLFNANRVG